MTFSPSAGSRGTLMASVNGTSSLFLALTCQVNACRACTRMAHSHVLSPANGALDATVMFVAEAVGRRGGAVTGVPLTRDETGKRFQRFLDLAGIARTDAFVTNAVLCNPLDAAGRNRTPTSTEVARCRSFLDRTLEIVRAPFVVALGRVALESLRAIERHDASLAAHVARPFPWRGRTLIPMYHPSRQSTLHRTDSLQEQDWRELGELVRPHAPASATRYHGLVNMPPTRGQRPTTSRRLAE